MTDIGDWVIIAWLLLGLISHVLYNSKDNLADDYKAEGASYVFFALGMIYVLAPVCIIHYIYKANYSILFKDLKVFDKNN